MGLKSSAILRRIIYVAFSLLVLCQYRQTFKFVVQLDIIIWPQDAKLPGPIRLVLHVGPGKTATSTIQCNLASLERNGILSDVLSAKIIEIESCRPTVSQGKRRNMYYREQFYSPSGNVASENMFDEAVTPTSSKLTMHKAVVEGNSFFPECILTWANLNQTILTAPDCWTRSYLRYIHNYQKDSVPPPELNHLGGRKNLFVISNEILAGSFGNIQDPYQCRRIFDGILATLGADSQIDILCTQRYYFDWLVSMHGQEFDSEKLLLKPKYNDFEGRPIPTIEEYFSDRDKELGLFLKALECFRSASDNNSRIDLRVIDFRGNVTSSFFSILARDEGIASQLSQSVSQKFLNTASSRSNFLPSNLIPYDRIAMAAYRTDNPNNLIPAEIIGGQNGRYEASKQFKHIIEERDIQLIYRCPSQEVYNNLLQKSISFQRAAFPLNHKIEEEVSKAFLAAVETKKFCDVDGDAMVANANIALKSRYTFPSTSVRTIYIACPAFAETGGPEALHQLCHMINTGDYGVKAYMLYLREKHGQGRVGHIMSSEARSSKYDRYNTPPAENLPGARHDNSSNGTAENEHSSELVIWPESWTHLIDSLQQPNDINNRKKYQIAIWWLSVNNNKGRFDTQQFVFRRDVLHLAQSAYARDYVSSRISQGSTTGNVMMMTEFIPYSSPTLSREIPNDEEVDPTQVTRDLDVVYNTAKGMHYTDEIIRRAGNGIQFSPIGIDAGGRERMTREEVVALLKRSKVYIDFGPHPGMDRLPREAALAGCVVVTNREGAANFNEDMPLPAEFKLGGKFDVDKVSSLLKDICNNHAKYVDKMKPYQKWILGQEKQMEVCVDRLVDKVVTRRIANKEK